MEKVNNEINKGIKDYEQTKKYTSELLD